MLRLIIFTLCLAFCSLGIAESRKSLKDMSDGELKSYAAKSNSRSDTPGFRHYVPDEGGVNQKVFGSEISIQEIERLTELFSNDQKRLAMEIDKLARENLREMQLDEMETIRHLRVGEVEAMESLQSENLADRLNSDWKVRERVRHALGKERPRHGTMLRIIAQMVYDGGHFGGVEYPKYMWKHTTLQFWETADGVIIRVTNQDQDDIHADPEFRNDQPMMDALRKTVQQLKAKGIEYPKSLEFLLLEEHSVN